MLNSDFSQHNSNYEIYKFFEKRATEAVMIYYLLTKRKEALVYLERLKGIRVELTGHDLKNMGILEGKKIGAMLDEILKKKLAGKIITKADEERFVKQQIKK